MEYPCRGEGDLLLRDSRRSWCGSLRFGDWELELDDSELLELLEDDEELELELELDSITMIIIN